MKVLGYMTSRGMGCMCKIKGKMTQDAMYLSILQDEVMKTIEWYCFNHSCVIFQHDNHPNHTANFDVLTWPPQSHDLDPIEHV